MLEPNDKHRFKSIYGSNYITEPQYLVEQFCAHVARQSQEDLIHQFWKLPKWTKFFKQQIPSAVQLLKKYTINSVLLALRDKRSRKVYSLRAQFFHAIIVEYYQKEQIQQLGAKTTVIKQDNNNVRKPYGKQTLLAKLKQ